VRGDGKGAGGTRAKAGEFIVRAMEDERDTVIERYGRGSCEGFEENHKVFCFTSLLSVVSD
jgi:hypothetical protein